MLFSFRPGVPERLGFGYETVKAINPNIIYHYAGAYGSTGPYHPRPAFHAIADAVGGGALAQAGAGMPPPPETPMTFDEVVRVWGTMRKANEHNPDPNSAVAVATGMMLGLYARERLGIAQRVETSMACSNAYANSEDAIQYAGKPPRKVANGFDLLGLNALYRLYRTKQGWVLFLACPQRSEWQDLCAATGRTDLLTDARFQDAAGREANDAALGAVLEDVFTQRTAQEWEQFLVPQDVPCVQAGHAGFGEYSNIDPAVRNSKLMVEVEHPVFGKHLRYGNTVDVTLTPGTLGPGCEAGQQTQEILREPGYSEAAIRDLKARQIVNWPAFVEAQAVH